MLKIDACDQSFSWHCSICWTGCGSTFILPAANRHQSDYRVILSPPWFDLSLSRWPVAGRKLRRFHLHFAPEAAKRE